MMFQGTATKVPPTSADEASISDASFAGDERSASPVTNVSTVSCSSDEGSVASLGSKRNASQIGSESSQGPQAKKQRRKWKKPKDKPKRPLSAYNLYFKEERERMVQANEQPKLGFRDMAKIIATNWNKLEAKSRAKYETPAEEERKKYFTALAKWKQEQKQKQKDEAFDKQMESLYDAFSSTVVDLGSSEEPLPIEPERIEQLPEKPLPTGSFSSLPQFPMMPGFDSSKLASNLNMMPQKCLSRPAADESPAMKRILATFDTLASHIDEEFVGFMTSLDWGNTCQQ